MQTTLEKPLALGHASLRKSIEDRIESLLVRLDDPANLECGDVEIRISYAGETTLEEAVSRYLAARENFVPPGNTRESYAEVA